MANLFQLAKLNLGLAPDPKLTFRSTTLAHLYSSPRPIPLSDTSYWSVYTAVFDFASDVPTLISSADIRKAIRDRPKNIANLLRVLIFKLDSLVRSESTRRLLEEKDREESGSEENSNPSPWRELGKKVPSTLYHGAAGIVGVGSVNTPKGPLREILNCVRVLTRILPFLMDHTPPLDSNNASGGVTNERRPSVTGETEWTKASEKEKAEWAQNLFWECQPVGAEKEENEATSPGHEGVVTPIAAQFVIDEEDEEEEVTEATNLNSNARPTTEAISSNPQATHPPLFATLIDTIAELLFLPGVCVPATSTGTASQPRYPIWTGGIGCVQLPPTHRQAHNSAKVEVLRLLLVVLSQPLYRPPHLYATASPLPPSSHPLNAVIGSPNPALSYFCTQTRKPLLLALLCSFLNTSLAPVKTALGNSAHALTTIASGLGKIAQEKIGFASPTESPRRPSLTSAPSSSNLGGASQIASNEGLPSWCAHTLSVLLLPSENNDFRNALGKLHRSSDLSFILDHLLAILSRPMSVVGSSSLLQPSSCGLAESVILLYLIIDTSPRLLSHLSQSSKTLDLVVALIYICLDQKDAAQPKLGLVRLCGILLQLISAKSIGQRINETIELPLSIRTRYAVPGTIADFVIVSICSIIFGTISTSNDQQDVGFETVYSSLIISITNLSPHFKGLSHLSAQRLAQLLGVLIAPKFILKSDGNVRLLYYLLESFNNVIQYQMSDNPQLIYVLLRVQNKFDYLATFTLQEGIKEINRQITRSRSLARRSSEAISISESRRTSIGSNDRGRKGKGKMSEEDDISGEQIEEKEMDQIDQVVESVESVTAESVGRNGFVPTEAWVSSWRDALPLDTIQIMITELKPKITTTTSTPTPQTLSLLSSATLIGKLPPVPMTPKPRPFTLTSIGSQSWIATQIWSLIYLRDSNSIVVYLYNVSIELFVIKHLNKNEGRLIGLWRGSFGNNRKSSTVDALSSSTFSTIDESVIDQQQPQ
ncbi:hypothetical protein CROQUDRAFT_657197 [Cronartium quercuum f. sp. fusiforme G11]|uniref:Dymeclin n=1 Tax=Cronartium quercuum f. sp. fusiforme G11 TaxID=708437 RepID=A0A9P6TDC4_9BASI|nr:hypothetical protein CROQUDRAFT_657197 [Cronartium quercuum f. sp. fusiforme G11]